MHEYGVICFLNCPVSGTAGRKYPCTFMWHDAFSIVLCLEQQGGGMHVHECGVMLFSIVLCQHVSEICMNMA